MEEAERALSAGAGSLTPRQKLALLNDAGDAVCASCPGGCRGRDTRQSAVKAHGAARFSGRLKRANVRSRVIADRKLATGFRCPLACRQYRRRIRRMPSHHPNKIICSPACRTNQYDDCCLPLSVSNAARLEHRAATLLQAATSTFPVTSTVSFLAPGAEAASLWKLLSSDAMA
jgi:hypothetical protein